MLRVLHCIYDDPGNPWVGGGGAVRVHQLYRRLLDEVEVTVVTGAFPGARDEVRDGVPYRRLGARAPYAVSRATYGAAASRLLRQERYDAAVFDFSVYTPIVTPRHRPVGITVHHVTGPTAAQRWGRVAGDAVARLERRLLRRGRVFSATSTATHQLLRQLLPASARIVDVQAGVPDELFRLVRDEQNYLLYFGRLDWFQKGLDVLLDAAAILAAADPTVELWIAGRGKDAGRMERQIVERKLQLHVRVLGAVSDAERLRLLRGAQVLLMPSRFEGFGMVAAEAMAAGVPVVAAAAGSLPEVIAPPEGGVLVPVGDPKALATAVRGLITDPSAREALARSARASAERFRWSRVAARHHLFLQTIAAGTQEGTGA